MAKVEPNKIVIIYGDNHQKSLRSAIDLLKAKVSVKTADSTLGNKSPVNVLKRV